MKKVLFTAKVDSHIIHFHIPFLKMFKEQGYEVHVASEGNETIPFVDYKYDIKFGTNPFSTGTIATYKELKNLMVNNEYDIVHTHTAIASVLTRLVANSVRKKGTLSRVIYTAHGFHFMKGGSIMSWLLYFPIEKMMGKYTDDLITINEDDYNLALKYKFCNNIHYINGIGVDIKKFQYPQRKYTRKEIFTITYIAELNKNKNQKLLIDAVSLLSKNQTNFQVQLVGQGEQQDIKEYIAKMKVEKFIKVLGYRQDIVEILKDSDIAISTSKREGLPINIIESMASGLPIVVTDCRGNNNLVQNNVNGFLVSYNANEINERLTQLLKSEILRKTMGESSVIESQKYSIKNVEQQMYKIYFNKESREK